MLDLHSPHYDAEGASFPGTGLVELGRGRDYAWSATSAGSDLIDQRLEQDLRPGRRYAGRDRHVRTSSAGKCVPMMHETFTRDACSPRPAAAGARRPRSTTTSTGPGTASCRAGRRSHGKPVAIVEPALDVQPRHRLGGRLPRLRRPARDPRRAQLDAVGERDRLHVQLVLRRQPRHRLLRQRPRPASATRTSTRRCRRGGPASAEWQRLPVAAAARRTRSTRARASSSAGTTSRRRGSPRRRPVRLRPDLPLGDAGAASCERAARGAPTAR